jgi:hypothetical protein
MEKAKVVYERGNRTPQGYEGIMKLVHDGEQIGSICSYWPWSYKSVEEAENTIADIAKRYNVEVEWY